MDSKNNGPPHPVHYLVEPCLRLKRCHVASPLETNRLFQKEVENSEGSTSTQSYCTVLVHLCSQNEKGFNTQVKLVYVMQMKRIDST